MRALLNRSVNPTSEPVTIQQVKDNVHMSTGYQDDVLTGYIKDAREAAENYQLRSYMPQKWQIVLDSFVDCEINLLRGPIVEVESVIVTDINGDETSMDLSDFIIITDNTPGRMLLKNSASWPSVTLREIAGVKITYSTGYGTAENVPATVKQAIILYASFMDDNRAVETPEIPAAFYSMLDADRIHMDRVFS